MMKTLSTRTISLLYCIFCFAVLAVAAYLQYHDKLEPCPLCVLQRLVFVLLGILFLMGTFFKPMQHTRRWLYVTTCLFGLLGLGLAGTQLWIMNHPQANAASCTADLQYLLTHLPWQKVLSVLLSSSASCSEQNWDIVGFNLPELSAISFAILSLGAAGLALRKQ